MRILILWVLLLSLGPVGRATQMRVLTVEELATRADVVVQGVVDAITTSRDAQGRIFTSVCLREWTVWKGRVASDTCHIVSGGGVLGDRAVTVSGSAEYDIGEEIVAYLSRNSARDLVTVGLAQGKFRVIPGPQKRRHVVNMVWGGPAPAGGSKAEGMTLDELKRRTLEAIR